jgi:hypothetical protein
MRTGQIGPRAQTLGKEGAVHPENGNENRSAGKADLPGSFGLMSLSRRHFEKNVNFLKSRPCWRAGVVAAKTARPGAVRRCTVHPAASDSSDGACHSPERE